MLARFQLQVDQVENGQLALDRLAEKNYDLVLMDCQMPVMGGYEATSILRHRESMGNSIRTPVIALTAHATTEARETCQAAGMDGYLSKPINRNELTAMLSRWLIPAPSETDSQQAKIVNQTTSSEASWNEAKLLEQLGGDEELLFELIELFIEEMPKRLVDLKAAVAAAELGELANIAHSIKGMVAEFFAETAQHYAAQLENSARHYQGKDMEILSAKLIEAVRYLMTELQQRIRMTP